MKTYCFTIKQHIAIEDAWQQLEYAGVELLYSSEIPEGAKEIYGNIKPNLSSALLESMPWIEAVTELILDDINWFSQWALHGKDFHDGFVHIDLASFGCDPGLLQGVKVIKLEPGPGFGDLSHPTTALVLKMMALHAPGAHVLDIGCGSGILALAAAAMGALSVQGVDIDLSAIEHAKKNAKINSLERKVIFGTPEDFQEPKESASLLVLMNMIASEQVIAYESLSAMHAISGSCLVSGILEEDFPAYLKQAEKWGWKLISKQVEDGWSAMHFTRFLG